MACGRVDVPVSPATTFTLLCHVPVVPGQGMITGMTGGTFMYIYPVADPTTMLTSARSATRTTRGT